MGELWKSASVRFIDYVQNSDGVGDLRGIASKVSYLKDLGIDGVWLSPIMKSPQADYGYDISDYRDIHYEYGNLTDFGVLLAECQKYGVKLILDLVPNHSSDEHGLILFAMLIY